MMTRTLLARCAPLAIAASVALPSAFAAAQDTVTAEPVIVLPEPAPVQPAPAVPAPVIVLPETVAEPAPPAPVQAEPETTTSNARAAPRAAAPARPAPTKPARTSTVATAPVARTAPATSASSAAPAPAIAPVAPVETAPQAPVAAITSDTGTGEIALAALLGALGLAAVGGIAFAASRRRRRNALEEPYEPAPYGAMDEHVETATMSAPVTMEADPTPAPVFTAPAASAFTAPVVAAPLAARPTRSSGDPIALPQELPQTFEERDALLKELVAAEPDKANPFSSPRARARRAKLIMQSLGRSFREHKPRIDLSEYTNRWPALRGWQPATA